MDETLTDLIFSQTKTFIDTMFGESLMSSLNKWLTLGNSSSGSFSVAWGWANSIYDSLKVIGAGLMILFLLIRILSDMTTTGIPTIEMIAKHFIRLFVGYVVIVHGLELLQGISGFADSIYNTVQGTISNTTNSADIRTSLAQYVLGNKEFAEAQDWTANTYSDDFLQICVDKTKIELCIIYVSVLMRTLGANIVNLIDYAVVAILIARGVQIILYTSLAPIALSGITSGHDFEGSSAIRFVKKYFGVLLQGALIVLIIYTCRILQASVKDEVGGIGYVGFMIAIRIAQLTLVQRSQQFVSDIVGG